MNQILVIAKTTFREAIRDKILYGILAFSVLYLLLILFLAKLSLEELPMIKSFGLAGIYVFGLVATVFLGSSLIYKEIERRTLYFIISKPVSRTQVIVGKFFGLYLAVAITIALMSLVYLGVIAYKGGGFDTGGLLAIFLELLELAVLTSLLTFFSSIMAPLLATISAVMLLFLGHVISGALEALQEDTGGAAYYFFNVLHFILPALEKFNVRNIVVHELPVPSELVIIAALYAALYTALLIYLASIFFKKREL